MQSQKFDCCVAKIFDDKRYVIPIYQRNYAWETTEIEQLLDDIFYFDNKNGKKYYLGTLVLNEFNDKKLEVIDGQQRLTTLYLILKSLKYKINKNALVFESRQKSTYTLKNISNNSLSCDDFDEKIEDAMCFISKYFQERSSKIDKFKSRLENDVYLFLINIPAGTDRNQYFEIMNTRGEQLEKHDILKGRIFEKLSPKEQDLANMIWSACENMNSYVQSGFDTSIRRAIFGNTYTSFCRDSFDDILNKCNNISHNNANNFSSIDEIIASTGTYTESEQEEEGGRFKSIISFPTFLLVANRAMYIKQKSNFPPTLDDKQFLSAFENYDFSSPQEAKRFLFELLKLRFLFDQYIIKTDYKLNSDGEWSLQMAKKQNADKKNSLFTTPTFKDKKRLLKASDRIKYLEAILRITYTAPRTMEWISEVLANTSQSTKATELIALLESYACKKIEASDYQNCSGFGFERIVFTYLDYMLVRDGYSDIVSPNGYENFSVIFRNSIEHFHPQNPSIQANNCERWQPEHLNCFGNLALVTVSGNSRFSNIPPESKVSSSPKTIAQSPKLVIMAKLLDRNNRKWTKDLAQSHGKEMLSLIQSELNKK